MTRVKRSTIWASVSSDVSVEVSETLERMFSGRDQGERPKRSTTSRGRDRGGAGKTSAIVIATKMAERKRHQNRTAQPQASMARMRMGRVEVEECGGLHLSDRGRVSGIDRKLRGRAGRPGDRGVAVLTALG